MFRSITRPLTPQVTSVMSVCGRAWDPVCVLRGAGQTAPHPFSNTREPHRSWAQTPPDLPCCAR